MSNLQNALELCRRMEPLAALCGGHVALTGGCLYSDGERKDIDILVYRIRQVDAVDWDRLKIILEAWNIEVVSDFGWCKKAKWDGHSIDLFDPEADGAYDDVPVFGATA
ncbi:MAG: hypothetical protein Unbinned7794contig1000_14 [Prokaryotic dsDNA virus sp.]|nr:MAG: hypothetical protein Unbinned7794contig1000_14 [Prokaryotic dsDNA virus sp.]|tara:strand:+ start:1971 stop:2297 length:327 start_codon:yes stop_codon:yes gene_type:complete